jgi:hypothetical protein
MLFDLLLGRARSPNSMFDFDHTSVLALLYWL